MTLFLFSLCFPFLFLLHKKVGNHAPLARPPVSSALFGIIQRNIFLFILSLNSSELYSRTFNRDSLSKLTTGGSIRQWASWRLCLSLARNWQRKKKVLSCFIFSTIVTWVLNVLWTYDGIKRLNFSRSLVSNSTPTWSRIKSNVKIMWKTALTLTWNGWKI